MLPSRPRTSSITLLTLTAAAAAVSAAPIAISGTTEYTENFNALAATSSTGANNAATPTPWADDTTIPGWWLYRAGNGTPTGFVGAAYAYRVSDGAINPTTGWFYSAGITGDPDRMLAAVPITAQGELSAIAVFQNTSAIPVRLTTIRYAAEIRHTNQTASNVETLAVWWRKGTSQQAVLTMTTAPATADVFPPEVSTAPSAHYITGWNRVREAEFTYTTPTGYTPVDERSLISTAPVSEIRVEPGEFLAIRWSNINDGGADALMGLDDLSLSFTAADVAISAAVGTVTRSTANTPRNPADDTVSFPLTITGTGPVSPSGWRITAPPALAGRTGTYGSPVTIGPLPIASFTGPLHSLAITIEDRSSATITTTATAIAPWCRIDPAITGFNYFNGGTPDDPTDDSVSYQVTADGPFTGPDFILTAPPLTVPYGTAIPISNADPGSASTYEFTDSADPDCRAAVSILTPAMIGTVRLAGPARPLFSAPAIAPNPIRWTPDNANRTLTQNANPQQADHIIDSETVDLTQAPDVRVRATLTAIAGTSSGFEIFDSCTFQISIDGTPYVSMLGAADTDGDGKLTGGVELPATINTTRTFTLSQMIPAAARSVQLRLIGNSNSPTETFTLSNLIVEIPPPAIAVSSPTGITRNPNGPGPADDTISFTVTITGEFGGTGWIAPGATPSSGPFGTATLTVPAGSSLLPLTFSDASFPSATATINVPLPAPWIIGFLDNGNTTTPIFTATTPEPDPAWVVSGAPPAITMNDGDTISPAEKSILSDPIPLAGITTGLRCSATLRIRDLTGGFEASDTFSAFLILNDNPLSPVSLISAHDRDGDGRLSGTELCPAPATNPTIQEFQYDLSGFIPQGTTTAQIVITGLCNSINEFITVTNLRIAPGTGTSDADGDGISDSDEAIMGTSPSDPNDVLRILQDPADPQFMAFATKSGRFYRLYSSSINPNSAPTHLQQWSDTGVGFTGSGQPESFTVSPIPGTPRRFLRLHVMPTDGPWPPSFP
ncbi:MAG: hypothetical protein RLZZ179_1173 [Verrucomicrobiota bacterium]|jgi:hypothetical protein